LKLLSSLTNGQWFDRVTQFEPDQVVHVYDVFEQDYLQQLFARKGQPKYVVSDHFALIEDCYCVPLATENWANKLTQITELVSDPETTHCFNFQINKKQVNRFLCMKLVEYFELDNYDYTWSGVDNFFDMTDIITEMNRLGPACPISSDARGKILSPITIPKKFVMPSGSVLTDKIGVSNQMDIPQIWQQALKNIFCNSAISLITESLHFQQASVFTEKTLYSVLGMTFPIWIGGGYGQADQWKSMGFDTFDDIINHDYQHYDTLFERCYYAFALNFPLLKDLKTISALRKHCQARLLKNQNLILNNHLKSYNDAKIASWPADLQALMPEITRHYRNTNP
jgi:hypothetical protein